MATALRSVPGGGFGIVVTSTSTGIASATPTRSQNCAQIGQLRSGCGPSGRDETMPAGNCRGQFRADSCEIVPVLGRRPFFLAARNCIRHAKCSYGQFGQIREECAKSLGMPVNYWHLVAALIKASNRYWCPPAPLAENIECPELLLKYKLLKAAY